MNLLKSWGQERSDSVTQTIGQYKFPTRGQLSEQTGYSDTFLFKTFWFMYASSFGMRNHEKRHTPVHYNDVATNTAYRSEESGFVLKPRGMVAGYAHDLPEDLGDILAGKTEPTHSLPAAHVIIDTAHRLLAKDTGIDLQNILQLLTNQGGMIFNPVRKYFESRIWPGEELTISPKDLVARLDKIYGNFFLDQETVNGFYGKLIQRWQHVQKLLKRSKHDYLPHEERVYIDATLEEFIKSTQQRRENGDIVRNSDLISVVKKEYEIVRDIILSGSLVTIDPKLKSDLDSEVIRSAELTIYSKLYLQPIMDAVIAYAAALEENPGVVKNLDARDNSARMGPHIEDIISQFMKYNDLLEKDAHTVRVLKTRVQPYQILEHSKNFLYYTLNDAVKTRREYLTELVDQQTQYKPDLDKLTYMASLMPNIGKKIDVPRSFLSRMAGAHKLFF